MAEAEKIWHDILMIREKAPLVHNITNYVVMNSTANALLALGASPVMAHAIQEVDEMVSLAHAVAGALVINIGTLSEKWIDAMASAMRAAKKQQVPIIFDPVGAGATKFRTQTSRSLLLEATPTIVRGNASEIMALLNSGVQTKGVDSSESSEAAAHSAKALALTFHCVACISGATDVITDGRAVETINNGHPLMAKVTGLGCTASALCGAFAAVNPHPLLAATHAMAVMGIAGELAAERANGPGSLQLYFYDALYNMKKEQLEKRLR